MSRCLNQPKKWPSRNLVPWATAAGLSLVPQLLPAQEVDAEPAFPNEPKAELAVSGVVLDPYGNPIEGAALQIAGSDAALIADAQGGVLLNLEPGSYQVTLRAEGFAPLAQELLIDEAATLSGVEFLLSYESQEVDVREERKKGVSGDTPVRVQSVGREELERRKATNLADAVEQISGVRLENNCQNCGFVQIRLNGLEGHHTQILIDGRPMVSTMASVYIVEQMPQEVIERVEVLKGGGSSLYGANAVGGVINIVTRSPTENFAQVDLRGSNFDGSDSWGSRINGSAGMVSPDGKYRMHLFGGGMTQDAWDANDDGFTELNEMKRFNFGATSEWTVFDGGELKFEVHGISEGRRGGDQLDQPEFNVAIAEAVQMQRYGGSIRWEQLVNTDFSYDLGYSLALTQRDSYYGGGGDVELPTLPTDLADLNQGQLDQFNDAWTQKQAALGAYGQTSNQLHVVDGYADITLGKKDNAILTVGGQGTLETLEDDFPVYSRVVDDRYTNIAGIAELDWLFAEWGEVLVGARVDKHSQVNSVIASPRASLMLDPLDWLRTRTVASTGFRPPQVFDEDLHITIAGGEGQVIQNADGLTEERAYSLAQQLEASFDLANDWSLTTGINGYVTWVTDAFIIEQQDDPSTPDEIEFLRRNRGTTTVTGAEFDTTLTWRTRHGLALGATAERLQNDEPDEVFNEKRVFRTPNFYGFVELFTQPTDELRITTFGNLTGPMLVPHYAGFIPEDTLETSPVFFDWNANISYHIDVTEDSFVRPYLGVRNILNSYQSDFDEGPERDAGYFYGPRMPRTFFFGIEGGI